MIVIFFIEDRRHDERQRSKEERGERVRRGRDTRKFIISRALIYFYATILRSQSISSSIVALSLLYHRYVCCFQDLKRNEIRLFDDTRDISSITRSIFTDWEAVCRIFVCVADLFFTS